MWTEHLRYYVVEGGEIIKFPAPSREGDQQLLRHECSRYAIAGLGASISRRLCDIMHISFNLRVQLERVDLLCPVHPIYTTYSRLTYCTAGKYYFRSGSLAASTVLVLRMPTGNGKKLSCGQAQLGQATCLAFP